MNEQEMRALAARGSFGRCDGCGHDAYDRNLLGVPIGPTCNVILVACGSCRASYHATGRLPFGLMHCNVLLTDEDVTDDLHARGYCDEHGNWPASGAAS